MPDRKRFWKRRDRDELERWYEEKVAQGLIDDETNDGPYRNWCVKRHAVCLRT